mmetsp:Transcript_50743/g.162940  ORF Transcript_50743/g.162940 Transcript_50743/m.162940 type:complete len:535 (-) Transcript_50743:270-1874(-)
MAPVLELAILVAGLGVAALGLLGVVARLAPILHLYMHRAHALADTASALGGAATPSLPLADDAIEGAGVCVAALLERERRACHAIHWMNHDGPALDQGSTTARGGALVLPPLGDVAVGDEDRPAPQLVELAADLLQGADLRLEVVLLVAALLHFDAVLVRDLRVLLSLEVRRGLGLHLIPCGSGQISLCRAQFLAEVRDLRLHDRLVLEASALQLGQLLLELRQHVLDAGLDLQKPVADLSAAARAQGALVGGDAIEGHGRLGHLGDVQSRAVVAHARNQFGISWILALSTEAAGGAARALHDGDLVMHLLLRQSLGRLLGHRLVVRAVEALLHVAAHNCGVQLVQQRLNCVVLQHHVTAFVGHPAMAALDKRGCGRCRLLQEQTWCCGGRRGSRAVADDRHNAGHDIDVCEDDLDLGLERDLLLGALLVVLVELLLDLGHLELAEGDRALGLQHPAASFRGLGVEGGDVLTDLLEQCQGLAIVCATLFDFVVELRPGVTHHLVQHVPSTVQGSVALLVLRNCLIPVVFMHHTD